MSATRTCSALRPDGLDARYDVIILPHDSTAMITGEEEESRPGRPPDNYPPEYMTPSRGNDRYASVVRYADRDILQSGWLIGEKHLSKKAAMVSASVGDGRVVLVGFRTQHRAQTHGTFKLLFNALLQ